MSLFKTIAAVGALLALSGCGFRPLYGDPSPGSSAGQLAQIEVARIEDRIGQLLRNHLLTALNPHPDGQRPLYLLRTTLRESTSSLAVQKTAFATRANLKVLASFQLSSKSTGEELFSAERSITVSYNILDSEFATLAAEKDARKRAIRELSEDIRLQLGVYFSRPNTS